jgi:hypothetical protein
MRGRPALDLDADNPQFTENAVAHTSGNPSTAAAGEISPPQLTPSSSREERIAYHNYYDGPSQNRQAANLFSIYNGRDQFVNPFSSSSRSDEIRRNVDSQQHTRRDGVNSQRWDRQCDGESSITSISSGMLTKGYFPRPRRMEVLLMIVPQSHPCRPLPSMASQAI